VKTLTTTVKSKTDEIINSIAEAGETGVREMTKASRQLRQSRQQSSGDTQVTQQDADKFGEQMAEMMFKIATATIEDIRTGKAQNHWSKVRPAAAPQQRTTELKSTGQANVQPTKLQSTGQANEQISTAEAPRQGEMSDAPSKETPQPSRAPVEPTPVQSAPPQPRRELPPVPAQAVAATRPPGLLGSVRTAIGRAVSPTKAPQAPGPRV
jgi:hypothetical protein